MTGDLRATLRLGEGAVSQSNGVMQVATGVAYALAANVRPSGSVRVDVLPIVGADLSIRIRAEGNSRAHEILLRFRKQLGDELGKSLKLGVKKVVVDRYDVDVGVSRPPLRPLSLPFIEKTTYEGGTLRLSMRDISEVHVRDNYIDRLLNLAVEKIDAQYYAGKSEQWSLIWSSPPREHHWMANPSEEMLNRNWIKQGPTKGRWAFRPQATAILRAMERIAIEEVLVPLGFEEIIVPNAEALDVVLRTGHLFGVPNEAYYLVEPKTRSTEAWETYRDLVKVTRDPQTSMLRELLTDPVAMLTYAQCPNIYWSFQGKTVADASLPIKVFDRAQVSNRYESGGRHGIERVDEFHRIEPVFIGARDQLISLREMMIERYKRVFDVTLELEWRMAQVTPFYLSHSGSSVSTMDAIDPRGTIDFEAYLPFRGRREDSEWLEFQNLSIIGDKYTTAFNIQGQTTELWSGCSGIGLERWTVAMLSQKGMDPAHWPEGFRRYLPRLPSGTTFL